MRQMYHHLLFPSRLFLVSSLLCYHLKVPSSSGVREIIIKSRSVKVGCCVFLLSNPIIVSGIFVASYWDFQIDRSTIEFITTVSQKGGRKFCSSIYYYYYYYYYILYLIFIVLIFCCCCLFCLRPLLMVAYYCCVVLLLFLCWS
jgi:hypothetical protein